MASTDLLVTQTGRPAKAVRAAIARLTSLGFVARDGKQKNLYRALARPIGA
jgi:DNA-binding IclR family transcriptional regulator